MVAVLTAAGGLLPLVAQEAEAPLLKQLDPPRRAIVLMALLGLVLLGIALVAAIMIGGRWVRRMARSRPGRASASSVQVHRRAKQRAARLPQAGAGETIVQDRRSDETISD